MKKKTNSAFHNWKLISRNFSEVDSDLPQDIRDEALMCFEAAVSNRMAVGDAIQKVQKDVLSKCDERFKGQRYKGFIKFDFDTNVISITVSKNIFRRKKSKTSTYIGNKYNVMRIPFYYLIVVIFSFRLINLLVGIANFNLELEPKKWFVQILSWEDFQTQICIDKR